MSPGDGLIRQRVAFARHLLEASDRPTNHIAHRAGLGTAASLRQRLHTTIGVSPLANRRTFRAADRPADRALVSAHTAEADQSP